MIHGVTVLRSRPHPREADSHRVSRMPKCSCRSGWFQAILIPGDQVLDRRAALANDDSAAGTSSRTSRFLPGIHVLRHYRRAWLRGDVLAGCTVAAYLVPQVMAYAEVTSQLLVWQPWFSGC